MPEEFTKEYVKKVIFEAFKNVSKGAGRGARECAADDNYASLEDQKKASELDIEQYWWEYPKDLIENGTLDYSLSYNNKDGIKFHIPALMTADIDGHGEVAGISVFSTLCLETFVPSEKKPHNFHREYVAYIQLVSVSKIIEYYDFNFEQVHAIALYFLFDMRASNLHHYFFDTREAMIDAIKREREQIEKQGVSKENYNLTLEDSIAIKDEEHRIARDWLKAGVVDPNNFIGSQ